MPLKVQSLDELDPADVEAAQAELSQLLQEKYPEVELARGVIHDIVCFLSGGISGGINQTEIRRVLDSRSLLAIQENPELSDPELVDHVLSNFLISRKTGTHARGDIAIVVEGDATVVIPAGALYTADGMDFRTDSPITARPPGSAVLGPNDRVLSPRGDGTYEFTVPATSEEPGEAANVRINSRFIPGPPPPRFVTAFSAIDFVGGTSTETNAQLINRLETGIPAKVTAGRLNIESLIRAQPIFADVKNISIVGYGDSEMTRDQHWIFPVSGGGRIDIYAQTDAIPQTVTVRKLARIIELRPTSSIWQLSVQRDDAPGFYEVAAVRRPMDPTDVAGFQIVSDQRGSDLSDDRWVPDIVNSIESAYTRYQTAVVRFEDTLTAVAGLNVGDEAEYSVNLLSQPHLRELQEFLVSDGHRHLTSDILVKGAVPCFLSLNCDIVKDVTESAPNLSAIRVAVAAYVNRLGFPGALYASQVLDVIHDHLFGSQAVGSLDMHGLIRRPDGQTTVIRDQQVLRIPDSPSTLVTPRTVAMILYPEDIGLAVVNRGR